MSEFKHMTHKFRPVLTLEQMFYITELCKSAPSDNPLGQQVIRVLVPMIAKVEVGAINPAYKLSETHALKQQEYARRQAYENGHMTPQEEQAYETEILGL